MKKYTMKGGALLTYSEVSNFYKGILVLLGKESLHNPKDSLQDRLNTILNEVNHPPNQKILKELGVFDLWFEEVQSKKVVVDNVEVEIFSDSSIKIGDKRLSKESLISILNQI